VGKSGVLELTAAICLNLKRVKIEEKLLWRAYRNLTNGLSNGTIPDPVRPPHPQDWGFATPETSIAIISGTGKATDFKFGWYIYRVYPNKSPFKILDKRERGHIQGLPTFLSTPYYLRNG